MVLKKSSMLMLSSGLLYSIMLWFLNILPVSFSIRMPGFFFNMSRSVRSGSLLRLNSVINVSSDRFARNSSSAALQKPGCHGILSGVSVIVITSVKTETIVLLTDYYKFIEKSIVKINNKKKYYKITKTLRNLFKNRISGSTGPRQNSCGSGYAIDDLLLNIHLIEK